MNVENVQTWLAYLEERGEDLESKHICRHLILRRSVIDKYGEIVRSNVEFCALGISLLSKGMTEEEILNYDIFENKDFGSLVHEFLELTDEETRTVVSLNDDYHYSFDGIAKKIRTLWGIPHSKL